MATKKISKSAHQVHLSSVRDLMRTIAGGLKLQDVVLIDQIQGEEHRDFCRFCHETFYNPYFETIIKNLYFPQIMYAAEKAEDYDHVTFNRASCNGVSLVREMFGRYAKVYEDQYKGQGQPFDPTKSFESLIPEEED